MYENIAQGKDISNCIDKICGAMGLARRAGKLSIGSELCIESIRAGKAKLVFLCSDMSDNSSKKLHDAMRSKSVPYIVLPLGKVELAKRIGKSSFAVACALTDKGFANIVYKALGITEE